MKKLLSIVLLLLFLLSTVSCNKEAVPTGPSETSGTTGTTEGPLPPKENNLLEEYAFVLTDDFWNSYDTFLTRQDEIEFDYLGNSKINMNPNFVSYSNIFLENYSPGKPIIIGLTNDLERYSYCFAKDASRVDNIIVYYSPMVSFDHTKDFVDINDFEVKELVEQPNENMRHCPDRQTGYYVLDDAIYYYYDEGNLQFVRWVCGGIQITVEIFADTEGYGFHSHYSILFMDKSTTITELPLILEECGLPPLTKSSPNS